MKRVIALLLAMILFTGVLPIDAAATEQEFVNVQLVLDGKPRQYKVIESGSELMFSGEDLSAIGGYEYRVEKGSAYFTRGMKTLRVDLDESRMYPFEDITLVGKVKMAEKVREVDSVYYFPGTEMLPWLNVDCFVLDGRLNICKDEVSIWEIIPVFDPEEFEFDFTACCKELGVNGKYLKARAYLQDEGLTGMFFDIIPVVGDTLDYYDLFEDIVEDQSAAEEETEDLLEDSEDLSYWMEIADDFEVIEDLPDELRLFGEVANFLSNNAVSFSFEMASYVKNFYQNHENILAAFHSMIVNSGVYKHQLPMTAISALMEVEESYTDYYAGIEYKMMKTIGETAFEGLASVPSGLFEAATTLVGFAEATSPNWAEGINRISSYDMIAEYCVKTYGELTDHTWVSSIKDMCGLAYMYLYSCEQNWNAMADYAIKEGKLDLAAKYKTVAESAEEWQRMFMEAVSAAMNDSHEYEVVDGSMKQVYRDKLKEMFSTITCEDAFDSVKDSLDMIEYIGKDISDVVNDLGNAYVDEYWEGGHCYTYDDLGVMFFFDDVSRPSATEVYLVVAYRDRDYGYGLSVQMTFPEIVDAVSSFASEAIPKPEGYYPYEPFEDDDGYEYITSFMLDGLKYTYFWTEDPETHDSYMMDVWLPYVEDNNQKDEEDYLQSINILADGIYDVSFSPMDFSRTNEGINLTFKYYDYDTVEKAYAMNLRVGDSINQNGEVVIIEAIEFDSWVYYDLEMHSVSINDGFIYYQTDTKDPSVMAVFDDTGLFPRYSYVETVTLPLNHAAIFYHETNPYDDAVRIQYSELMDYMANNYGGAYEQATTLTVEDGMIVEIYHTWIP